VASAEAGRALAERASEELGSSGRVFEGGFAAAGARVWRGERVALRD
jgi:hypothetical protein